MQLNVDKNTCAGHGICVILAPDLFQFDQDERAEVTQGRIPAHLECDAASAVAECPTRAITASDG